mgnify:CR=1 FL=1
MWALWEQTVGRGEDREGESKQDGKGHSCYTRGCHQGNTPSGRVAKDFKKQGNLILTVKLFPGFTANPHPKHTQHLSLIHI